MTTQERRYEFIDKSPWGPGPWQEEGCDKTQWVDEATGLDCLAVRTPDMGHWCGYVGVPEGHPAFGVGYDDVSPWPEVHGGLTYAAFCREGEEETGVCHRPFPGRPERLWWLGFDCAHSGDLSPGLNRYRRRGEIYRDLDYVRAECARLAGQLAVATS